MEKEVAEMRMKVQNFLSVPDLQLRRIYLLHLGDISAPAGIMNIKGMAQSLSLQALICILEKLLLKFMIDIAAENLLNF